MGYDIVRDRNGYQHTLTGKIDGGGQGDVYRTLNPNVAVKLAFDKQGKDTYSKNVSENEKYEFLRTLPLPEHTDITLPQVALREYEGYVMTLLGDMKSFESAFADVETDYTNGWLDAIREGNEQCADAFAGYIATGGIRRRLEAYFRCASTLAAIHAAGLVYCDFSANNVFISEEDAKAVWLIDADNLNFQSHTMRNSTCGTPRYRAPEVVNGKGNTFYSDCYSFAVSLFWNLTRRHPFDGALIEICDSCNEFEERAEAGEFPWILDPEDGRNRLGQEGEGMPSELAVSPRLMECFSRTFSAEGRKKRSARTTMFEWTDALAGALDQTVRCPGCGMDYCAEESDICPWCDAVPEVMKLVTYRNGNAFWTYKRELTDGGEIAIPLRVIEGVRSGNLDEAAFCLRKNGQIYAISGLHENYDFRVETEKGGSVSMYGEVVIPKRCRMTAVKIGTHSESVIEVAIG